MVRVDSTNANVVGFDLEGGRKVKVNKSPSIFPENTTNGSQPTTSGVSPTTNAHQNPSVEPKYSVNDFSQFKGKKDDALGCVNDAINAVKTTAVVLNLDPNDIDYSDFPDPTNYTSKDSYDEWCQAVNDWKSLATLRLSQLKNDQSNKQHEKEMNAIYQIYKQLGVTQEMIKEYCESTNQSLEDIKHNTQENADKIKAHIDTKTQELENDIMDAEKNIKNTVELTTEQTQVLNALSGSIDVGLQSHSYRDQKKEMVLNKRNEILNDENLTFEDKKNKLTTLSNIVTQGDKVNEEILKGI